MSNAGLDRYLGALGLTLARAAVGDRYVLEEMHKGGFNVGGEQSGHIILSDFSTTGDGLIAALQVLAVLAQEGKPASEAAHLYRAAAAGAGECALQEGLAAGRCAGEILASSGAQCQAGRHRAACWCANPAPNP